MTRQNHKLNEVEVNTLREKHQKTMLLERELAVQKAALEFYVAKLFVERKLIQGIDIICLHCGAFKPAKIGCDCLSRADNG